jgi:hypothetical protein
MTNLRAHDGASIARTQMALLANAICLGKPGGDFIIDFLDVLEAKGVQMISRRESFDPAKARMFQAARQDHVAIDPISPDHEGGETHPDLKCDARFLGENGDRPIAFRHGEQLIENRPDNRRFAGEV